MKCKIIKTNEHSSKVIEGFTFKSKAGAIQYLKWYKKTWAHKLYSESKYSPTKQALICHHADNDNVTTFTIKPI
jgi:hypothetical protein